MEAQVQKNPKCTILPRSEVKKADKKLVVSENEKYRMPNSQGNNADWR